MGIVYGRTEGPNPLLLYPSNTSGTGREGDKRVHILRMSGQPFKYSESKKWEKAIIPCIGLLPQHFLFLKCRNFTKQSLLQDGVGMSSLYP